MKMFADPDGRGGVLEPEGTVEIRFRQKDLIKTMHRCDNGCKQLLSEFHIKYFYSIKTSIYQLIHFSDKINETNSSDEKKRLEKELHDREGSLLGMYHQVALSFADLHDTPMRMLEKGCICDIVSWHKSRNYFYWHLRRALYEDRVRNEIQSIICNKNDAETSSMIRRWFIEQHGQHNVWLPTVCPFNYPILFIATFVGRRQQSCSRMALHSTRDKYFHCFGKHSMHSKGCPLQTNTGVRHLSVCRENNSLTICLTTDSMLSSLRRHSTL